MKISYARVSTREQSPENHLSGLADAGCEMFFEEKVSGAVRRRPRLKAMLEQLRKDDVVVVTKLDCLERSTIELLRITEVLNEKSAGIQSLDEPWADSTSPSEMMIMSIFGDIAEFERSLILTLTQEGREAAKARGVAFGRPPKLKNDQKKLVLELVNTGKSISAVARAFNVHSATIYRCINESRSCDGLPFLSALNPRLWSPEGSIAVQDVAAPIQSGKAPARLNLASNSCPHKSFDHMRATVLTAAAACAGTPPGATSRVPPTLRTTKRQAGTRSSRRRLESYPGTSVPSGARSWSDHCTRRE